MLTLFILGKTASLKDGEDLTFRTRKAEAILYYLVIVARAVDRTTLAELFWPNMTTANAQKNLRTILPDLRASLGDYLIFNAQEISFNQQLEHWVDYYQLRQLLLDSSLADTVKLARYEELYQGELLARLNVANTPDFETWLERQREELAQKNAEMLQALAERSWQQGTFKVVQEATRLWLALQPWAESAHRLRMKLFWHDQQRSAALLQYNQCFEYLQEELGIEPSPETKKLYIQIQQGAISQSAEGQTDHYPQPKRHNLPRRFSSFVGRKQELALLRRLLLEDRYPLVTVVGEGGVGKTRLTLALAEQIVADAANMPYYDGVWFVSCAGISEGNGAHEQLIITIGAAIGLDFQGTKPLAQQLLNYLTDKSLLLILDNFEHLTRHIALLLSWLEKNKDLQLIVTSRHELNLKDSRSLRLEGMSIPPLGQNSLVQNSVDPLISSEELAALCRTSSVQLLSERAKKVWPSFAITQQNGLAAAKLCQLLAGNPLALELAATLIMHYDLATLASELSLNYSLLAAELQDLPPRQRSIYNTIDYSWRLLPPELATLLAQCSVFRGIFSQHALSTITDAHPQQIEQLVQRSLLHHHEEQTIQIHEMVRQFAANKLLQTPSQHLSIHQKHSEYYIHLLSAWWEDTESKHIVSRLLPHLDNIYAAWEWAFDHQSFEILSRAITAFTHFHTYAGLIWEIHLRVESYYQRLQEQMAADTAPGSVERYREIETALTYARAVFQHNLGNIEEAATLLKRAQANIHQYGYLYLAANTERYLGYISNAAQCWEQAQQHLVQSIHYAKQQHQSYSWISSLHFLASLAIQRGESEQGITYLQQAYELLQCFPDVNLESTYHAYYADLYHAQGQWSAALASAQKTLALMTEQRMPIYILHTTGKILWQSGRYSLAKEYLERVDSTTHNDLHYYPGKYWHTVWLIDFSNLYIAWQQPQQALFYSQQAKRYAQKQGQKVLLGRAQKAEGAAQMQLEQWGAALTNLNEARAVFHQESASDFECTALTQLIHYHLNQEDEEEIQRYCEDMWNLLHFGKLDMTNVEPIKAWWACYLGLRALGDARAETALRKAAELFRTQRDQIDDEVWREQFSTQIVEHAALLKTLTVLNL